MPIFVIHEEDPNSPRNLSSQGSDKDLSSRKTPENEMKNAKGHQSSNSLQTPDSNKDLKNKSYPI